jgi:hypothetical protein
MAKSAGGGGRAGRAGGGVGASIAGPRRLRSRPGEGRTFYRISQNASGQRMTRNYRIMRGGVGAAGSRGPVMSRKVFAGELRKARRRGDQITRMVQ